VTPFHHQPEAQHPKYSAIHKNAGRLPHLLAHSGRHTHAEECRFLGHALIPGGKTGVMGASLNAAL
jgi:predicted Rossmann-fold nucleotide-binding protein